MTEEEQALAQPLAAKLSRSTGMEIRFWGGYEGAVRVMLGVFPQEFEVETDVFRLSGTPPIAGRLTNWNTVHCWEA